MASLTAHESMYHTVPRAQNTLPHTSRPLLQRPVYGQGKSVMRVTMGDGNQMTFIPDRPYDERARMKPIGHYPGSRAMHRTTYKTSHGAEADLGSTAFKTTHKDTFGGSADGADPTRPQRCRSMHVSGFNLAHARSEQPRRTHYHAEFSDKYSTDHVTEHMATYENKSRMNVGSGARSGLQHANSSEPHYWTAYRASHDKLGLVRGPGEPKDLLIRQSYNPLTGEHMGSSWKFENKRVSGNRELFSHRQDHEKTFCLG